MEKTMSKLRANGEILISRHNLVGRGYYNTYKWEGGPIVAFSYGLLRQLPDIIRRDGNFINVGPFHLRVIEDNIDEPYDDPIFGQAVCIREGPHAWTLAFYIKWLNFWAGFWHRIVVTLAVWGLADYHDATIPHLGDIHLVQWLRRFAKDD